VRRSAVVVSLLLGVQIEMTFLITMEVGFVSNKIGHQYPKLIVESGKVNRQVL
jgi:hypothetical protein